MGSSLSSIYPLLTKPSHTDISFPKTHSVPSSLGAFVLLRPLLGIPAPRPALSTVATSHYVVQRKDFCG